MEELILVTGNEGKVREFGRLLGTVVLGQKIALPEIQETDVRRVAQSKAQAAYDILKKPVFVDDTGLYIEAWGQLPGALIAWFLDNVGNEGILKMLDGFDNRTARVITALGYCDETGTRVFVGEVTGTIAKTLAGDNGFGYDPIFIPQSQAKTFAQMTNQEKDRFSMRSLATQAMKQGLGF